MMKILDAMKVVDLMRERNCLLDMRSGCESGDNQGWAFMVNDRKFPIPTDVKKIFLEAIDKAITHYNSQIEKI